MAWHDLLREKLRGILGDASHGGGAPLDVQGLAGALAFRPSNFPNFFKAVQYLESHDEVYVKSLSPRIPALANPSNQRDFLLAYYRWLEGFGRDVVVVVSLNEFTFDQSNYRLGFPQGGRWLEVFNSDFYENFPNPNPRGNDGSIFADGPPLDGFSTSAGIVIPANAILVFAKDAGD
jgi:hypothetical protein